MGHISENTIFQEERREEILKILDKKNRISTNELIEKFNTTAVTIRKDLTVLEKSGALKRTHGGAIKKNELFRGLALTEKEKIFLNEKLRIVKEAANLIKEGDTIILDSGSTTNLLAKEILNKKNITVITNALNIAVELINSNIEVILTGGNLFKDTLTLIGPLAETVLKKLSSGKLFLGTDGIDFEHGLTTPNLTEASTSQTMMNISGEIILLVDESKFGRRSLAVISKIEKLDKIITNKKMTDNELSMFKKLGVEITTV